MVQVNLRRVLWIDLVQETENDEISYYVMFDNGKTLDVTEEEGKQLINQLKTL